jgi:hypothetical protein
MVLLFHIDDASYWRVPRDPCVKPVQAATLIFTAILA